MTSGGENIESMNEREIHLSASKMNQDDSKGINK